MEHRGRGGVPRRAARPGDRAGARPGTDTPQQSRSAQSVLPPSPSCDDSRSGALLAQFLARGRSQETLRKTSGRLQAHQVCWAHETHSHDTVSSTAPPASAWPRHRCADARGDRRRVRLIIAGLERRRYRRHDGFDDDAIGMQHPTQAASDDPQQTALDWAACMRKNGIDVPDPEVGSDGRIRIGPGAGRGADDIDRETFQAAQKECGSPIGAGGGPQLSAAEREEMQATMLEFAACMRENGVDMPDPDFSGGGGVSASVAPGQGASILTTRRSARRRRPASRSCRTPVREVRTALEAQTGGPTS